MAKKAKVKRKLPTVTTGPLGGDIGTVTTGPVGGLIGSALKVKPTKLLTADRVGSPRVPLADSITQQINMMEQSASENASGADAPGVNAYDPEIGYATVRKNPDGTWAETGREVVEREKLKRRAKVKRKGN